MARDGSEAPPTQGGGIERRELLKAGAVVTAGFALFPVQRAEGGESKCPEEPYPYTPAGECKYGDPGKPEAQDNARPLGQSDEDCEVVLGLLWGAFADAASSHTTSFYWDVFVVGRHHARGEVLSLLAKNGSLDELIKNDFTSLETDWGGLGRNAGSRAASRPDKLVTGHDFIAAWKTVYNEKPPNPAPLPIIHDEAVEVIGDHLWAVYAVGVKGKKGLSQEILQEGRNLSRGYLWKNVENCGVVSPGCISPHYERWDFGEVGCCAVETGKRANKKASNSPAVSKGHFRQAWKEVSTLVSRFRNSQPDLDRASGCS